MLMPARRLEGARPAGRAGAWVNGSLLFGLPTITLCAAVRTRARHAVRRGALGADAGGVLRAAGGLAARTPATGCGGIRGQSGHRHGLHHAHHAVRARRAQHRRRLGARGRGAGLAGIPAVAGSRSRGSATCCWRSRALWLLVGTIVHSTDERDQRHSAERTAVGRVVTGRRVVRAAILARRSGPIRRLAARPERVAESLLIGWGTLWLGLVLLVEIDTVRGRPATSWRHAWCA